MEGDWTPTKTDLLSLTTYRGGSLISFQDEVPVVKVQNYSLEEIFKKKLVAFLPYYIMRYEKQLKDIDSDKEKLLQLLQESAENVKKGVADVMGGKVLQLESERLRAEGEAIGEARGVAIGEARGVARGEAVGEARGVTRGKAIGEARLAKLINLMIKQGKADEIAKVTSDEKVREEYYTRYEL